MTTWAGRIAAGEARLMAYIGELDERRAWAVDGILSCVHWLSWRLGMGPNAAGERVRVARALRQLPAISAAFGEGRLSYSQVRAISRVATPADEQDYIGMARHATGNQLERLVRGVQRARKLRDQRLADQAAAAEGREPSRRGSGCPAITTTTANCASPSKPAPPTVQCCSPPSRRPAPIFPRKDPTSPTAGPRR